MTYEDVEAELRKHPAVRACVVTRIQTGERTNTLVAYVVTNGSSDPAAIRAFLSAPRLPAKRIPQAVIPVQELPRTSSGELDRKGLPLPVLPGRAAGGKEALFDMGDVPLAGLSLIVAVFVGVLAFVMTTVFWPGSTDLSVVPQPYAGLFTGLYVAECLSFGLGVSFLLFGRGRLTRMGRPPWLTSLAHLSVVWLLVAWWPQDNFYRLAAKTDWGRQAVLVYAFNITLMIAAVVLVAFALRERRVE
ncbi:AMP-binding enzyme [Kibdelosporangium phytohabitans]|uniref:AMP-binding enzyme C-terminal domain-containing protein n=1 Tax=Kibdelosporangium phytohabitans TaxID=860235 RepID=A0A0N9HVX9_9PSEU|nr:hypothetical protein [Kibdelosporangium phytohabitans]ALG11594.1 hypothetical protein AOZ06_36205 [Kibdelosporangium phytohabitans]MBE1462964.1 hypothetical protein [Kibdelosporangium phytohabitans]